MPQIDLVILADVVDQVRNGGFISTSNSEIVDLTADKHEVPFVGATVDVPLVRCRLETILLDHLGTRGN